MISQMFFDLSNDDIRDQIEAFIRTLNKNNSLGARSQRSLENLAIIFLTRVGIDLISQEKLFSNQHPGLLGKNASGLKSSRKILHDPTQLLNISQSMLCYAESIAELCLRNLL